MGVSSKITQQPNEVRDFKEAGARQVLGRLRRLQHRGRFTDSDKDSEASEDNEDPTRDKDPSDSERRPQHHSAAGHSERPFVRNSFFG